MPRSPRRRIATGIYRDKYSLTVVVRGQERAIDPECTRREAIAERQAFARELARSDPIGRGTLEADEQKYTQLVKHLADWRARRAEIRAWVKELGPMRRRRITRAHILEVRTTWLQRGVAPKTINNRVSALRHLYHLLDGEDVITPCDKVPPLPTHRTPAVLVEPQTILEVDRTLQAHERRGWLRDAKTRARFRVLASTGVRPSELQRAKPTDVSLERRVWTVRDGKGGFRPGLYLTDDMLTAWRLFIQADAWGRFNTGSFARRLRKAGWPEHVRPYQLRHSVGITLSERGIDLADVQQVLGHTRIETTRRHYVPVLHSRMQRAGEALEGRLPWSACPTDLPHETSVDSDGTEGIPVEKTGLGQHVGRRRSRRKSA